MFKTQGIAEWKPGRPDFLLGRRHIIFNPAQGDRRGIEIIYGIGRIGIAVPRLAYTAHIDQILVSFPDIEGIVKSLINVAILVDEGERNMCVTKKTDIAELVPKVGFRSSALENVIPSVRIA